MQIWKAHYKDRYHDIMVDIINTEDDSKEPLSFIIDGIKFAGRSLADFELADNSKYDEAKKKFCILKYGGYTSGGYEVPYYYELQRYALDIEIPVKAVNMHDESEVQAVLCVSFEYTEPDPEKSRVTLYCDDVRVYYDDMIVHDFTLNIGESCYSSTIKTLDYETALHNICSQIADDYCIKCCFTCQYSDYSPYGNDYYGCMLCYRSHKDEYLKVNSKDDYFEYLYDMDYEIRQETYLCSDYATRNKCSGYRGFV